MPSVTLSKREIAVVCQRYSFAKAVALQKCKSQSYPELQQHKDCGSLFMAKQTFATSIIVVPCGKTWVTTVRWSSCVPGRSICNIHRIGIRIQRHRNPSPLPRGRWYEGPMVRRADGTKLRTRATGGACIDEKSWARATSRFLQSTRCRCDRSLLPCWSLRLVLSASLT